MKDSQEIKDIFKSASEESNARELRTIDTDMLLLGIFNTKCAANMIIDKYVDHNVLKEAIVEKRSFEEKSGNTLNVDMMPLNDEVQIIHGRSTFEFQNVGGFDEANSVHLILAILSDTNSDACKLFEKYGIDYENFRDNVINKPKDPNSQTTKTLGGTKKPKSLLEEFGKNLNQLVIEGKIKQTIAREEEIERCIEIISCRDKNTPILTGEPGVGKTAIAEGIAYKIVNKQTSPLMFNKVVIELDLNSIVAGTKYRGQFEERMKLIMKAAKEDPDVILFMDEFHTAIGAGNQEAGLDIANILKPALARGDIKCITATTIDEYRKIKKDTALDRRLQEIQIDEPSIESTTEILDQTKEHYAKFHNVSYSIEAIEACVELSDKFITNRFFPDKAIDLLDRSGAVKKLQGKVLDERIIEIDIRLESIMTEKAAAIKKQDFSTAQTLKEEENILKAERILRLKNDNPLIVTKKDIEYTVSSITGIPMVDINRTESDKIIYLDKVLKKNIIGQDDAINKVMDCINRRSVGIKDPKRPIGSFIFLGNTGIGKTELAKQLGKHYFFNKSSFIKFDMSEYMEKHSVSKLIGAPPGYVGYEEGGQLTEKVRRTPYSLILLDEIEKAHHDVFNILLQVLEDGILTDSLGRKTYFKNSIIIMTSNVGSSFEKNTTGFIKNKSDSSAAIMKAFEERFSKEFINRLDEVIIFKTLTSDDLMQVLDLAIEELMSRLKHLKLNLDIKKEAKDFLLKQSDIDKYGARKFKHIVLKHLENLISKNVLNGNININDNLKIIYKLNELKIEKY